MTKRNIEAKIEEEERKTVGRYLFEKSDHP